jgi:hypothetical protein
MPPSFYQNCLIFKIIYKTILVDFSKINTESYISDGRVVEEEKTTLTGE